jgi:hypothetical protein
MFRERGSRHDYQKEKNPKKQKHPIKNITDKNQRLKKGRGSFRDEKQSYERLIKTL